MIALPGLSGRSRIGREEEEGRGNVISCHCRPVRLTYPIQSVLVLVGLPAFRCISMLRSIGLRCTFF